MNVVIVGNGVAGIEAAIALRAREPSWTITIISEESDHFFSRTALMWVATGQLSHACIEPYERDLYERLRLTRVRARATGIDFTSRRVQLGGSAPAIPFDRLLIACGSRARRAPWPGAELAGVGHFVTLQDLLWLEHELHAGPSRAGAPPRVDEHLRTSDESSPYRTRPCRRALSGRRPTSPVVVGGGLIGIEAIEVMLAAGLRPRFFLRDEWFWPLALDRAEAEWIAARLGDHGVTVHLSEPVTRLEGERMVEGIVTERDRYGCDLLVAAIGVVPNTDWIEGLDKDAHGGIVVDEQLRTSQLDVFASGDCASVPWVHGTRMPEQLWYTAREQGRVAGRVLAGDDARYVRGGWYNSAKLMDIEYTSAGLVNMNVEHERNWFFEEQGSVRSTVRVVLSGERVVGFNLLGRRWDHTVLLRWIAERRELDYVRQHLTAASFDTELVPPLEVVGPGTMSGPAPSPVTTVTKAP